MKMYLFALLLAFAPATAQAEYFLNKNALQSCSLKQAGSKKMSQKIMDNCAQPQVAKECKAHGLGKGAVWEDCPFTLISQVGRWVRNEHAALRKVGGKKAKAANALMTNVGDAKKICRGFLEGTGRVTSFQMDFCRAVILSQTYGMLHVMNKGK